MFARCSRPSTRMWANMRASGRIQVASDSRLIVFTGHVRLTAAAREATHVCDGLNACAPHDFYEAIALQRAVSDGPHLHDHSLPWGYVPYLS